MTVAFVPENLREVFEYDIYIYKNSIVDIRRRTVFASCLNMFSVIC